MLNMFKLVWFTRPKNINSGGNQIFDFSKNSTKKKKKNLPNKSNLYNLIGVKSLTQYLP